MIKVPKENDNTLNQIYVICDEWSRRSHGQADQEGVSAVKAAAREYKHNFDGWIGRWDKQQAAANNMVENAREFTGFCDALRAGQKAKMASTIAGSNTVMVSASLLAVAAGLVLAFVITRGITRALNRIIEASARVPSK